MSKQEERNLSIETCKMIEANRQLKGISRAELAKMVKVSTSYIFNIETSRRRCVSYNILKNIADALVIDLHTLLGQERMTESIVKSSFETMFFNSDISIDGYELSIKQKLNAYEILKTLVKPNLSKSKKLEHIISTLFDQKEVCTSA